VKIGILYMLRLAHYAARLELGGRIIEREARLIDQHKATDSALIKQLGIHVSCTYMLCPN
jgi:hypothetical protein